MSIFHCIRKCHHSKKMKLGCNLPKMSLQNIVLHKNKIVQAVVRTYPGGISPFALNSPHGQQLANQVSNLLQMQVPNL
jgi:hypothetical protein